MGKTGMNIETSTNVTKESTTTHYFNQRGVAACTSATPRDIENQIPWPSQIEKVFRITGQCQGLYNLLIWIWIFNNSDKYKETEEKKRKVKYYDCKLPYKMVKRNFHPFHLKLKQSMPINVFAGYYQNKGYILRDGSRQGPKAYSRPTLEIQDKKRKLQLKFRLDAKNESSDQPSWFPGGSDSEDSQDRLLVDEAPLR